jgi:hypothetical protein
MADTEHTELKLSATEVQGMMIGGYEADASLQVADGYMAWCIDGECWSIENGDDELVATVNPTNAISCREVVVALRRIVADGRALQSAIREEQPVSD